MRDSMLELWLRLLALHLPEPNDLILGIEEMQFARMELPLERKWLQQIGHAFLDLLDGKLTCTASSTEIMPGSKPYRESVG